MHRLISPPRQSAPPEKDPRSGAAVILAALFCLVLVPVIGLGVDGANIYLMKNQINTALDGAVLAGARSLNVGMTIEAQNLSATTIAQTVFNADISGIPNLPTPTTTFGFSQNTTTYVTTVTGSVTANLPVILLGLIHISNVPVNTTVTATRRNVNVVLVLDHSGGMTWSTALADMQADATTFVNLFANGRDNIGLVTFTGAPFVADAFTQQTTVPFLPNVPNDINSLTVSSNSYTNTSAAMWTAYQQLLQLNEPGALNVIVLFTDGLPGAFTGDFSQNLIPTQTNCSTTVSPLEGVLWTNTRETFYGGLAFPNWVTAADSPPPDLTSATGCASITTGFLSSMPAVDFFGNSTNGPNSYAFNNNNGFYGDGTLNISTHNIIGASVNALDGASNRIRNDTNLNPRIFVVALTGNPLVIPPDPVLLARIANDPTSVYYNANQPSGQYIPAPTLAQLQTAFSSIASQVLKLASN